MPALRSTWSALRARIFVLAVLALLASQGSAYAQAAAETGGAAQDRATSFQAVEGAVKEDVPGGPLMVAAYGVVWLAVLAYVFRLSRLHARVEDSLSSLERALAAAPPKPRGDTTDDRG